MKKIMLFFAFIIDLSCCAINVDSKAKIVYEKYSNGDISYLAGISDSNDQLFFQQSPSGKNTCLLIPVHDSLHSLVFSPFLANPHASFDEPVEIDEPLCSQLFDTTLKIYNGQTKK